MRALLAWTTGEMTGKMVVGMEMETKKNQEKKHGVRGQRRAAGRVDPHDS